MYSYPLFGITLLIALSKHLSGDNLWKKSFTIAYGFRRYGLRWRTPNPPQQSLRWGTYGGHFIEITIVRKRVLSQFHVCRCGQQQGVEVCFLTVPGYCPLLGKARAAGGWDVTWHLHSRAERNKCSRAWWSDDFLYSVQSRTSSWGMVLTTFRLGLSVALKVIKSVPPIHSHSPTLPREFLMETPLPANSRLCQANN